MRELQFLPSDRLIVEQDNENKMRVILDPHKLNEDGSKSKYGMSYAASTGFYHGIDGVNYMNGLLKGPLNTRMYQAIKRWPEDKVKWQSERLRAKFEEAVEHDRVLIKNAKIQTDWRNGVDIKAALSYFETNLPLNLHQGLASHLAGNIPEDDGYGYLMEQGTGKTAAAISTICHYAKRKVFSQLKDKTFRTLIVVPPALKLNWIPELDLFSPMKGFHCLFEGAAEKRMIKFLQYIAESAKDDYDYMAMVVSYDTLVNSKDLLQRITWDLTICDESQWFKDPSSKRWKALQDIRDASLRRLILTGTPIGNNTVDIYTQLEFLREGASTCASFKDFKKQFSVSAGPQENKGVTFIVKSMNNESLKEIISRRCFTCKKDEVLADLPEKIYELVSVDMTPEQKKIYKQVLTAIIAEIEDESRGKVTISTDHVLKKLLRLAQITSGYRVIDEIFCDVTGELLSPREEILFEKNPKIDQLMELAKELPPDEKMIIWNHWNALVDPIYERFVKEGFGNQICVYRGQSKYDHPLYNNEQGDDIVNKNTGAFNSRRDCRFLLANPASANMGLTLVGYPPNEGDNYDTNCTEMVYISYDWSYLKRAQADDRAHRIGTRRQLRIRDLLVPNTIDQEIIQKLKAKKDLAEDMADVRNVLATLSEMGGL